MSERLIVILIVFLAVIVLILTDFGSQEKVYDCRIVEISPDVPPEVREQCRKLLREIIQPSTKQYI